MLLSTCTDWLLGNAIGRETTSRGARQWVATGVHPELRLEEGRAGRVARWFGRGKGCAEAAALLHRPGAS